MSGKIFFISAIDTHCGKSVVTGVLALYLGQKGHKVITQKLVQTGCMGFPDDIDTHRSIMQSPRLPEDTDGLTCPYLFTFPASPHFAAQLEHTTIDTARIRDATHILAHRFEFVLLEGVGGLMVPLTNHTKVLDYVAGEKYPLLLVTSGRLGSINHTLLSLHACRQAGVEVAGVVYNRYPPENPIITQNTFEYLKHALGGLYPQAVMIDFPVWVAGQTGEDGLECWDEFYERSCSR